MSKTTKWRIGGVLFVVLMVVGYFCYSPILLFAFRIAGADCVIADVDRLGATPVSVTITGDAAREIVKGVSSARRDIGDYACVSNVRVTFYRSGKVLGHLMTGDCLFFAYGRQYRDQSGVLSSLVGKLSQANAAHPDTASLRDWEQKAKALKVGSTLAEVKTVLPDMPPPSFSVWNGAILMYGVDENTEVIAGFGLPGPALSFPVVLTNVPYPGLTVGRQYLSDNEKFGGSNVVYFRQTLGLESPMRPQTLNIEFPIE